MSTNTLDHETDELARQVSEGARAAGASAQHRIGEAARHVSDAALYASRHAKHLYGDVRGHARQVAGHVDPYVKGKPYAAAGLAAIGGLLLGLITAGRGPKVIYVRPKS